MAVELPEPLQWVLLLLAGTRWPEADEGQLRDMAEHWRKAAEGIEDAARSADSAVKRALDGQKGAAADALAKHWGDYTVGKGTEDDPGYLPGLVQGCKGMGDMLEGMANSAETAKIQIIAQLGILAFEIATAEAEAPFTAGVSMAEIPVFVGVSRTVVQQILKKLLQEALEFAVKQAVQMAAINLMAQTIELAEGHRKSIDMKELGQNALGGAVAGATGHLLGKGVGAAGTKLGLGHAMESTAGKMVVGAGVGVGTDAATQLITTGKVDSGSLLGSGLSGGAGAGLHAGAAAARDHFKEPPKMAPHGDIPGPSEGGRQDGPPSGSHADFPGPSTGGRQDGPPSGSHGDFPGPSAGGRQDGPPSGSHADFPGPSTGGRQDGPPSGSHADFPGPSAGGRQDGPPTFSNERSGGTGVDSYHGPGSSPEGQTTRPDGGNGGEPPASSRGLVPFGRPGGSEHGAPSERPSATEPAFHENPTPAHEVPVHRGDVRPAEPSPVHGEPVTPHVEPTRPHAEPSPVHSEPLAPRVESTPAHEVPVHRGDVRPAESTPVHGEPVTPRVESTRSHAEPSPVHAEPSPVHSEPVTPHVEPTPVRAESVPAPAGDTAVRETHAGPSVGGTGESAPVTHSSSDLGGSAATHSGGAVPAAGIGNTHLDGTRLASGPGPTRTNSGERAPGSPDDVRTPPPASADNPAAAQAAPAPSGMPGGMFTPPPTSSGSGSGAGGHRPPTSHAAPPPTAKPAHGSTFASAPGSGLRTGPVRPSARSVEGAGSHAAPKSGPVRDHVETPPSGHGGPERPPHEAPAPGGKRSHDEAFSPEREHRTEHGTEHQPEHIQERPIRAARGMRDRQTPTEHTPERETPVSGGKRSHDEAFPTEEPHPSRDSHDDGPSPAKKQRTPSYENTEAVLHGRGLKPPSPEQHEALLDHLRQTGEGRFPKPTSDLLDLVNPHKSSADGDSLHNCLEATEALRDTHYGRPRPSGHPLEGRPEPDAAWTLLKRSDIPRAFGEGQHGIDSVLDQVKKAGPGSFSTVLFGGPGKEGHALALIHGQDGSLHWADPSSHQTWEAKPGEAPGGMTKDDQVWAATSGPHEETISEGSLDHGLFEPDAPRFGQLSLYTDGSKLSPEDLQKVHGLAQHIDGLVQEAAKIALADPGSIPELDGYTKRWVETYREWADPNTTNERREQLQALLPRRFGYAVESMTTQLIKEHVQIPDGMSIETQVTHGSTRPDLVITKTDASGKSEIGWLDITASKSEGHIHNKQSTLWSSRPYVAETLYPSLDVTQLGHGGTPEQQEMVKVLAAARAAELQKFENRMDHLSGQVPPPIDSGNKAHRQNAIERQLGEILHGPGVKLKPLEAKAVLAALSEMYGPEQFRVSDYGYTPGGRYAEGFRFINERAEALGWSADPAGAPAGQ